MPRFAANLSLLFTELPYLDRFQAAAKAGFTAVEILFPYDLAAKETRRALLANGLDLVLINAPPPNYTGGAPGYAAVPGGEVPGSNPTSAVFCAMPISCGPGLFTSWQDTAPARRPSPALSNNLQWAADTAPDQQFTIEPLNEVSQPGYFLNDYDLAAEVLDHVDRPNVGLQYDSFHAADDPWRRAGDLASLSAPYRTRANRGRSGSFRTRSGQDGFPRAIRRNGPARL